MPQKPLCKNNAQIAKENPNHIANYLEWSHAWTHLFSQRKTFSSPASVPDLAPASDPALPPNLPSSLPGSEQLPKIARQLFSALSKQELPFLALDYADSLTAELQNLEPFFKKFKHLLLLGIGGSSLGARALQKAFYPQQDWPLHACSQNAPTLWVADNIDTETLPAWLERLPASKTLVLVISKSGGTVETLAQYFLLKKWLEQHLAQDWTDHVLLVTDAAKGFLREEAEKYNLPSLPVPEHLGGRYSALSAVGLAPAAFLGLDWAALLQGAKETGLCLTKARSLEECEAALGRHPAWHMALWANSLLEQDYCELIYFNYVPKFAAFGAWFAQLWAESLGKQGLGSMPLPALGVTDQHSLQQMFLDGPKNKGCLFISCEQQAQGPKFDSDLPPQWNFLKDRCLLDLFKAEALGTRMALCNHDIPLLELRLPEPTPYVAGKLMLLLELTTVLTGWLMGIDPLDQPAVELGKRLANASLSAKGLEKEKTMLTDFCAQPEKLQEF